MSRPRFFAGQLLTEEDLQSVVDYVLARHRLTNRHLFGDGVVCGLHVHRDPCNPKKVIVEPGHALDCCGNDILVPCPVPLDILKMVHELRVKLLGGFDCGDPCAEDEPKDPKKRVDEPGYTYDEAGGIIKKPTGEKVPADDEDRHLHLDLFIRYCERPTEPIAPYDVGNTCDSSACEWTRIHEGFAFELRCHEEPPPRPTMEDLQRECLPDKAEAHRELADRIGKAQMFAMMHRDVQQNIATLKREGMTDAEKEDYATAHKDLEAFESSDAAIAKEDLPQVIELLRRGAAGAKRMELTSVDDPQIPSTEESRARGLSVLEKIKAMGDAKKATIDEHILGSIKEALDNPIGADDVDVTFADHAQAAGFTYSMEDVSHIVANLKSLKRRVSDALLARDFITHGTLERELSAIKLDMPVSKEAANEREMAVLAAAADKLSRLARKVYEECVCAAVLPPCPPCDDRAVRIACLRVSIEKCEVVEICNFCRMYVLSGPALRYWGLDPMAWFIERARKKCCPPPCPRPEPAREQAETVERPPVTHVPYYGHTAMTYPSKISEPASMFSAIKIGDYDLGTFDKREPVTIETETAEGVREHRVVTPEELRLFAVSSPADLPFLSRVKPQAIELTSQPVRWRVVTPETESFATRTTESPTTGTTTKKKATTKKAKTKPRGGGQ